MAWTLDSEPAKENDFMRRDGHRVHVGPRHEIGQLGNDLPCDSCVAAEICVRVEDLDRGEPGVIRSVLIHTLPAESENLLAEYAATVVFAASIDARRLRPAVFVDVVKVDTCGVR